jgi:uncharacterized RDD family membrane protein YckC
VQPHPTKVVGARVGAYLIDTLLFLVLSGIAWFALTGRFDKATSTGGGFVIGDTRYAFDSSANRGIWLVLVVVFALAIFVIAPGLRGTSPGRSLTRIRVVNAAGEPPGVGRAFLRWFLFGVVDDFPYFIPGLTGFIVALNSRGNQRVGDMAAGTWVVRADAAGRSIEDLLAAATPASAQAGAWQQPALAGGWQQPAPPVATPVAQPQSPPAQPAGWYDDPSGQARLRYWDGSAWTEHTAA